MEVSLFFESPVRWRTVDWDQTIRHASVFVRTGRGVSSFLTTVTVDVFSFGLHEKVAPCV